jgi:hydroxypyruvate isomerase
VDLSACIDLLFGDEDPHSPADVRIRRAADAGLRWVEIWGWSTCDMTALKRTLQETGTGLTCLVLDPFVPLVDDRASEAFLHSVEASVQVAADVACPFVVVLAGDVIPGRSRSAQHRAVVDGLRRAAPIAEAYGVTLVLENLNSRIDHVGHYLDSTTEALDIIDEVGHPHVRMLYDLYHSVVMAEKPADVLGGRLDRIAHVQLADAPGRHEPGTGTIEWPATLGWLAASGYRGRLGLEYIPTVDTRQSLGYVQGVLAAISRSARPRLTRALPEPGGDRR